MEADLGIVDPAMMYSNKSEVDSRSYCHIMIYLFHDVST